MKNRECIISSAIGINPADVIPRFDWDHLNLQYHEFSLKRPAPKAKIRKIIAPNHELKMVQREILQKILLHVEPHPSATAFFPGRSIARNAQQHKNCTYLYKTDISNFFESIKEDLVETTMEKRFPHLVRPEQSSCH